MAKKTKLKDEVTQAIEAAGSNERVTEPGPAPEPTPAPMNRGRKTNVIAQDAPGDAAPSIETPEPEAAPEAAQAPTKKNGKKAKVLPPEATDAPVVLEPEPAPDPAPTKRKGKRAAMGDATLADAFAGYLRSLEDGRKSEGTVFSYRLELTTAGAELGLETKVADLTPESVLLFFGSDRVMKTRSGRPKSPLSIDKTRRVLRQALLWAEKAGLVAKAPLPEATATH